MSNTNSPSLEPQKPEDQGNLSNNFSPLKGDLWILIGKVTTILMIPIIVLLFNFVRLERKINLTGTIKLEDQIIVRSSIKDTLVQEINHKVGEKILKDTPVLILKDTQNLYHKKKAIEIELSSIQDEIKAFSNLNGENLNKPGIKEKHTKLILDYQRQYSQYEKVSYNLEGLTIKSPIEGTLINIPVVAFEPIDVGTELFEIIGGNGKYIKAEVPEKLYVLVHTNAKVYIKSQVYNYMWYQIFNGKVSYVSPQASIDRSTGETGFSLKATIEDDHQNLFKANTHVSLEIVRDELSLFSYLFVKRN